ncbi:MAG: efflux transporter outer membrane subunit [Planctomycetota bacterium]|jgi:NodT family efflux transporter outer membrane factor (OMF) lipoprotein
MKAICYEREKLIFSQIRLFSYLTLFTLFFPGCKVGPNYVRPELEMPDAWSERATEGIAEGHADIQIWWQYLSDPVLNSLIERAGKQNLDLKVAASRIRQSRAILGIAAGEYFPRVDAAGQYSRSRVSENGILSPFFNNTSPDPTNLHRIGVDATWEIDVFGRISRSVESAQASYQASLENYRDVLVILYAEVALNYVEFCALQIRIEYAINNIEVQKSTLELTKSRLEVGLAPELDVQQALLNLANTESAIPLLRTQRMLTLNRLSVLLGQPPGQLEKDLLKHISDLEMPEELIVGLPAELLRQRPDIRRAERNLAAQSAQIGVATAGLYPSFSLSGVFALEAQEIKDVGDWDSRTWGFGPSFRWNIFDGDRIRSNIQLEELQMEETMIQYEQTILLALEEVEDAMVAFQEQKMRLTALQRSVAAAEKSVKLVRELYTNGLTDFQNVLDMERSLTRQQDSMAESQGLVFQNLIRIYKSLGGGWSADVQQKTVQ